MLTYLGVLFVKVSIWKYVVVLVLEVGTRLYPPLHRTWRRLLRTVTEWVWGKVRPLVRWGILITYFLLVVAYRWGVRTIDRVRRRRLTRIAFYSNMAVLDTLNEVS